jgi:hypothetical protein
MFIAYHLRRPLLLHVKWPGFGAMKGGPSGRAGQRQQLNVEQLTDRYCKLTFLTAAHRHHPLCMRTWPASVP